MTRYNFIQFQYESIKQKQKPIKHKSHMLHVVPFAAEFSNKYLIAAKYIKKNKLPTVCAHIKKKNKQSLCINLVFDHAV